MSKEALPIHRNPDLKDAAEDPVYHQLVEEFPDTPPEAIEAALQFLQVASYMNLKKEECFGRHGLTSGRFALLMLLRHEPGRALSPSELAKRTQVTRGTMTQFVDALEKDNLVQRIDDPNDRRAMLVTLTSQGESLLKKVLPDHLGHLTRLTQVLNRSERRQFLGLMEKMTTGLARLESSAT